LDRQLYCETCSCVIPFGGIRGQLPYLPSFPDTFLFGTSLQGILLSLVPSSIEIRVTRSSGPYSQRVSICGASGTGTLADSLSLSPAPGLPQDMGLWL
jgi:hypothetical protein